MGCILTSQQNESYLEAMCSDHVQVLEVGIGSFPNALYLGSREAPQNMDIIGVDPNEARRFDLEGLPSGYVKIPIENGHRNRGFSH